MKTFIHKNANRGRAEHGWLHSRFSFSFAEWYDPERMGFGALRVLNDDIIEPGAGFGMHPHDNMEIITIVTKGTVRHKDSMGNEFDVPAGDVQVMSAGTGVVHSEYNPSSAEKLELFQIWILPAEENITPRYDQKSFGLASKNSLQLVVSPDGSEGSLAINQDAYIYKGMFDGCTTIHYPFHNPAHGVYLFVVSGMVAVGDNELQARDACAIFETSDLAISIKEPAEILILEVPLA